MQASTSSLSELPSSAPIARHTGGQLTVDFAPLHCLSSPGAADNTVGGYIKSN